MASSTYPSVKVNFPSSMGSMNLEEHFHGRGNLSPVKRKVSEEGKDLAKNADSPEAGSRDKLEDRLNEV